MLTSSRQQGYLIKILNVVHSVVHSARNIEKQQFCLYLLIRVSGVRTPVGVPSKKALENIGFSNVSRVFNFSFPPKIYAPKVPKSSQNAPKVWYKVWYKCGTNSFNSDTNYLLLSFMRSSSAITNLSTYAGGFLFPPSQFSIVLLGMHIISDICS